MMFFTSSGKLFIHMQIENIKMSEDVKILDRRNSGLVLSYKKLRLTKFDYNKNNIEISVFLI